MKRKLLTLLGAAIIVGGSITYNAIMKPSEHSFSKEDVRVSEKQVSPPVQNSASQQTGKEQDTSPIVTKKDSTGITYGTYSGPKPDISTTVNLGNGTGESKSIEAKRGQYIHITFTSNIRDELNIEGYNATTNVEPGRESGIAFTVNKVGQFPIKLVKTNKIVGTLIIKE